MPTTINMGIPGAARSVVGEVSGKRVLLAEPRGYCAGVDRAVETVERALEKHGAPVYVRHEIVHNTYVVNDLKAKGAIFIEELSDVPPGATLVFSAHGVSKAVQNEAQRRGYRLEDLRIFLVLPSNEAVREAVEAGAGATIISEHVVASAIEAGRLRALSVNLPPRDFVLLRHSERQQRLAERALTDVFTGKQPG